MVEVVDRTVNIHENKVGLARRSTRSFNSPPTPHRLTATSTDSRRHDEPITVPCPRTGRIASPHTRARVCELPHRLLAQVERIAPPAVVWVERFAPRSLAAVGTSPGPAVVFSRDETRFPGHVGEAGQDFAAIRRSFCDVRRTFAPKAVAKPAFQPDLPQPELESCPARDMFSV